MRPLPQWTHQVKNISGSTLYVIIYLRRILFVVGAER